MEINSIKDQISKGQIKKAIESFLKLVPLSKGIEAALLHLKAQHTTLQRNIQMGLIAHEQATIQQKKQVQSLLYLIHQYEKEVTSSSPLEVIPGPNNDSKSKIIDLTKKSSPNEKTVKKSTSEEMTILFVALSLTNAATLKLEQQKELIEAGFLKSSQKKRLKLIDKKANKIRDLSNLLLEYNPHVLHFCGNGQPGLILTNLDGEEQLIEAKPLADLFQLFSKQIECVILDSCYHEDQIRLIAEQIPFVIGIPSTLSPKASILFSSTFYNALSMDQHIRFAYDLACNVLKMNKIEESLFPSILTKDN